MVLWIVPCILWFLYSPLSVCSNRLLHASRPTGGRNVYGEWEGIWCTAPCRNAEVVYARDREHISQVLETSRSVRVVGSGHSVNALHCPDDGGVVLVVADLMCISEGMVYVNQTEDLDAFATFSAGCTVRESQEFLVMHGMHLKGFGSILEQRIGGALATTLHGIHQSAFSDGVIGVVVILANGTTTTLNNRDAALVHWAGTIGTLGVVVQVKVRVWPLEYATCETEMLSGVEARSKINRTLFRSDLSGFSATTMLSRSTPFQLQTCVLIETPPAKVHHLQPPDYTLVALQEYFGLSLSLWVSSITGNIMFSQMTKGPRTRTDQTTTLYTSTGYFNPHPDQEYVVPIENCFNALDQIETALGGTLYSLYMRRLEKGNKLVTFATETSCVLGLSFLDFQIPNAAARDSEIRMQIERIVVEHYKGRGHLGKAWVGNAHLLATGYNLSFQYEAYRMEMDPEGLFQNEYTREMRGLGTRLEPTYPPGLDQRSYVWKITVVIALTLSVSFLMARCVTFYFQFRFALYNQLGTTGRPRVHSCNHRPNL